MSFIVCIFYSVTGHHGRTVWLNGPPCIDIFEMKINKINNKRPVGLYSPLLIQIIQYCNKCLHVDASKTGWTPNKKVIKGIHLRQFAQHIHLLFWAKDHFHLNKRPDSLGSYSRLCVVTKCTQQNIPYQRDYFITFSLFDHTWAVFRSHHAWHLLMLVMICTKYRKNPLTTVAHSINKFIANLITSTTRVSRKIKRV